MKIISAEYEQSAALINQLPVFSLPQIAFAGRSNVGKSSLINCLLNRKKLALTSGTPGKTRYLNFYRINAAFYFVDLPGYGFAKVSQQDRNHWQALIDAYFQHSSNLRGVLVVTDLRHALSPLDLTMIQWLIELDLPFRVIATKIDKLTGNQATQQFKANQLALQQIAPETELIAFSAITKQGQDQIWHHINQLI
ncbi:ribosome biogenesis GTP-binding protein YihA/YsxC [candidate division KSB1 bacterium]|nr:ribosome biogenesis GTP-binding protein YihA/YsxC [candidate division KSB1 bacterium]